MKVLSLHHDQNSRAMTVRAMRRAGHDHQEVKAVDTAVVHALEWQPDIILCDIRLEHRSGLDVLRDFQRRPEVSGIPFMFLGSNGDSALVREALGQGGDDVLVAPFNDEDLVRAMEGRVRRIHQIIEPIRLQLDNLRAYVDEVKRLSEITEKINAGMLLEDVLEQVYASFRKVIPYDRIGLALLESGGTVLRARWARSESTNIRLHVGYAQPMAGSSLEEVFRTRRPRIINDLEYYFLNTRKSESTALVLEEGVRSSLTCPLIANGKTIGFLFFSSFERETYRAVHTEVFQHLAGQLSIIVEKARVYEELISLNELKNKFLGIAAHDLRNPIGVIQLVAETFLLHPAIRVNQTLRTHTELIFATCAKASALVNSLLDVSAIESGKLTLELAPVSVAHLLTDVEAMHRLLCERKEVALKIEASEDVHRMTVICDLQRLQQVFDNLLSNAAKFSPKGTTITFRVERTNGDLHCMVIDQGPGIPAEEVPKLFQEFGTTSVRPTGGERSTGLGLAIVKKLVSAHHGSVWVDSRVGQGSTFHVTIPVAARRDS